ncbi:collagen alpha-1(I) chain-like [Cervus elaphus]|uniref:collagen alpha-1(I) chain-like n=1 Tax=Cervus elaphus TaxID=9860 RepID=UPI001CC30AA3|nr:collagen alpha-1(I) chain-like [Cervus elaphus]
MAGSGSRAVPSARFTLRLPPGSAGPWQRQPTRVAQRAGLQNISGTAVGEGVMQSPPTYGNHLAELLGGEEPGGAALATGSGPENRGTDLGAAGHGPHVPPTREPTHKPTSSSKHQRDAAQGSSRQSSPPTAQCDPGPWSSGPGPCTPTQAQGPASSLHRPSPPDAWGSALRPPVHSASGWKETFWLQQSGSLGPPGQEAPLPHPRPGPRPALLRPEGKRHAQHLQQSPRVLLPILTKSPHPILAVTAPHASLPGTARNKPGRRHRQKSNLTCALRHPLRSFGVLCSMEGLRPHEGTNVRLQGLIQNYAIRKVCREIQISARVLMLL